MLALAIIILDVKQKQKSVGLRQTKKFLHNQRNNQQNEKATYKMRENICKLYIWWGVNIQNIKGTHKTQ